MRRVLVDRYVRPAPETSPWRERVRGEVERTWRMYADHPRVLQLMITVVIDEPDVLRFYSVLAAALTEAGLPDDELLTTIEVIDAFAFGAALDALSPDEILDPSAVDGGLVDLLARHPRGRERNRQVFERGLDLILQGITARIAGVGSADETPEGD
nr:TetR/AcrR family transcriptional regulator C-terminal domain-containing protein [Leucobacter weissii]